MTRLNISTTKISNTKYRINKLKQLESLKVKWVEKVKERRIVRSKKKQEKQIKAQEFRKLRKKLSSILKILQNECYIARIKHATTPKI